MNLFPNRNRFLRGKANPYSLWTANSWKEEFGLNSMTNGPLPPRKSRRKRRKNPVVYGFIALVLFLFSGVLYAQASGLFAEGEKPAQRTDAGKTSEDLAVRSGPADSEESSMSMRMGISS